MLSVPEEEQAQEDTDDKLYFDISTFTAITSSQPSHLNVPQNIMTQVSSKKSLYF